jgi:GGDEF domain-containing protein
LSGIGVQAVARPQQTKVRANVAISSTQRYAVGLEVRLPGPRHPLIQLTGASIKRDPAGITFSIFGRNPGNVILQNVQGSALITQGSRVAARMAMGAGTFVTGTSIAYPIPTPQEKPRQGAVYRVRAQLHYSGGVARLDTLVRFGRLDALRQQAFGGPRAPHQSGFPWLVLAIAAVALALAALLTALWRRRAAGERSPLRTLDRALAAARASGAPVSVIVVAAESGGAASRPVAAALRARLRRTDRLCRLDDDALLVVAPDTNSETADALAADLRRHIERTNGTPGRADVQVYTANGDTTAAELLDRVTHSSSDALAPH